MTKQEVFLRRCMDHSMARFGQSLFFSHWCSKMHCYLLDVWLVCLAENNLFKWCKTAIFHF